MGGTTYFIRVRARTARGFGPFSAPVSFYQGAQHAVAPSPVSWAFAILQPTRTASFGRGGTPALWTFIVPEPRASVRRQAAANPATWRFDVPEPTIKRTRARDAGPATWTFDVPEPGIGRKYRVSPTPATWTFTAPEPEVMHAELLPIEFEFIGIGGEFEIGITSFELFARFGFENVLGVHPIVARGFDQARFQTVYVPRVEFEFDGIGGEFEFGPQIHPPARRPVEFEFAGVAGEFEFGEVSLYSRARVSNRIIRLSDRLDLLISQWVPNEKINDLLRRHYELIDDEFVHTLIVMEDMRELQTAFGVWLDYIGRRLGMDRPRTDQLRAESPRIGFDGVTLARGFDQAPFQTVNNLYIPQVPVGDEVYRLMLRVWSGTLLTDGTIPDMNTAVQRAFTRAYYTDTGTANELALTTNSVTVFETAARDLLTDLDAWPRPAGVQLTVA